MHARHPEASEISWLRGGGGNLPGHAALSQRLLHVHVLAFKVHDDDVEVVILRLLVEILHV